MSFYQGPDLAKLRTQKAKSVAALTPFFSNDGGLHQLPLEHPSVYAVWPHTVKDRAYERPLSFPLFARPAPTTPQHGFVDSRIVNSYEDLFKLAGDANLADPLAELILMPPVKGQWSGIAVDGLVTFGEGNDGATAGKRSASVRTALSGMTSDYSHPNPPTNEDGRVLYPQITQFMSHFDRQHFSGATYGYLEFVHNDATDAMQLVQFRDGPEQSGAKDFIPRETEVAVVVANPQFAYDLNGQWPAALANLHADHGDGLVVWIKNGSLASHHAVHAILAGVPVVTSPEAPKVGDRLIPAEDAITPLSDADAQHIAQEMRLALDGTRFQHALKHDAGRMDLATLSHGVVHSQHLWGGDEHPLLRAYGLLALLPLASMAIHGEMRHWGKFDEDGELRSGSSGRNMVFKHHAHVDMARQRAELGEVGDAFIDGTWGSSYGGDGWDAFKNAAIWYADDLERFLSAPSARRWRALMEQANILIHLSHNNGRVFNKFTNPEVIAKVPVLGLITPLAAELAMQELTGDQPQPVKLTGFVEMETPNPFFQYAEAKAALLQMAATAPTHTPTKERT